MSAFTSSLRPMLRTAAAPRAALSARAFSASSSREAARITLTGRLGTEPEIRNTSTGSTLVRYIVATDHGPKDNRQVSWWRVSSFLPEGPQRDYVLNLPRGTLVYVEGEPSIKPYTDAEGRTTTTLNISQRFLEVLKRPGRPNQQEQQEQQNEGESQ
ncbi:hypothetical protein BJX61DRAFT_506961 [Aspergillus egyptiacus]|nr:hypothetical protein BJX61DRAFT_506961 [Aspergillus egyptiacus]